MPAKNVYDLLTVVIPLEDLARRGHLKLKSRGFLDLHVEVLRHVGNRLVLSLAHYFEQQGDLVPDPEMEVEVDSETREVRPLAIQMSSGHYTRVVTCDSQGREVVNHRVAQDLRSFLRMWLVNLVEQGFAYRDESPAQDSPTSQASAELHGGRP